MTENQIGYFKKFTIITGRAKWLKERRALLWIIHNNAASKRSARGDEHLLTAAEDYHKWSHFMYLIR